MELERLFEEVLEESILEESKETATGEIIWIWNHGKAEGISYERAAQEIRKLRRREGEIEEGQSDLQLFIQADTLKPGDTFYGSLADYDDNLCTNREGIIFWDVYNWERRHRLRHGDTKTVTLALTDYEAGEIEIISVK